MPATSRANMGGASDPATWVEEHGDALYRYALLRVRDADLAEELVQECFVAALDARARFAGEASERTWLVGILKRKVVDHVRRSVREQAVDPATNAEDGSGDVFSKRGLWRKNPQSWAGEPDKLLEDREFREILQRCLHGLPAPMAHAFLLREMDQLESDDVCKVLGISATNLWTRLHRARMGLRQCLENNWFSRR